MEFLFSVRDCARYLIYDSKEKRQELYFHELQRGIQLANMQTHKSVRFYREKMGRMSSCNIVHAHVFCLGMPSAFHQTDVIHCLLLAALDSSSSVGVCLALLSVKESDTQR